MRQLLRLRLDASRQFQVKAYLHNARCASKKKFENYLAAHLPRMSTFRFLIGQLVLPEGATNSNHLESAQCAPAAIELFNASIKY